MLLLQATNYDQILQIMSYKHLILILVLLFIPCGCISKHSTPAMVLHNDMDVASLGATISRELIEFASPPLIPASSDHPVLVLTPVDNDRINNSSSFGRALQNAIVAGLVRNGIVVNETKLRHNAVIDPEQGEFILTRNIPDILKTQQRAQAVVVGTYTLTEEVIYLSLRLVNPENGLIRSVYEQRHRVDENTLRMLGYEIVENSIIEPPRKSLLDKLFY